MAQLFGKGTIKQHCEVLQWFDDSKIAIIQDLYQDYKNGLLNDEVKYKEKFNQVFFWDLLGYQNRIHRIPEWSIPWVGNADIILWNFIDGREDAEKIQIACELKGAKSNLTKKQFWHGGLSPVGQWFAYKTALKNCKWLIVSNFFEIRLYRDNTTDFEERNLKMLLDDKDNYFNLRSLYLLLHRDNLLTDSEASKTEKLLSHFRDEQQQITKKFYQEYKQLRIELIQDLRKNNPSISVTTLVEKAQKIIDRLIFIFFCEDKGLLPDKKLKEWITRAGEFDISPREMTKRFFTGVDKWSEKLWIPDGYNGWLFKEDPILNSLKISDDICKNFVELTNYDFDDEISVNVLGHIFEQSISDLESLKEDLIGKETKDNSKWKRKKDGIFYTPEYIVDYIVQNSVMKYLNEKEDECLNKHKNKKNWEILAYQEYQQILQNIKVLDPACGSGAFLVRVFDVLFEENKRVGSILNSLFDDSQTYKNILTNNIYGVDLNAESVEITKLSLRLKSAQKGKKLNNLDANIKCGNSLIDDPAIAGDKAFKWEEKFSNIFHKEEIKTWMITWATHNTRISERMVEFGVKLWEPVIMDENDEIEITKTIAEITKEDNLKVLAYNICKDHVHMILQCTESERDNIVQKLKSVSARKYNIEHNITVPTSKGSWPLVHTVVWKLPKKWIEQNHLRWQKYNRNEIKDEKYLYNAIEYIHTNREHHGLLPFTDKNMDGERVFVTKDYIFDKIQYKYSGGFDVIVWNPPYVVTKKENEITKLYKRNSDLYLMFFEKTLNTLVKKWKFYFGFITPRFFLVNKNCLDFRKFLLSEVNLTDLVETSPFEDAQTECVITLINSNKDNTINIFEDKEWEIYFKQLIKKDNFRQTVDCIINTKTNKNETIILEKIEKRTLLLKNISISKRWIEVGKPLLRQTKDWVKCLIGQDVNKYSMKFENTFISIEHKDYKRLQEFFIGNKVYLRRVAKELIAYYDENLAFNKNIYWIKINNETIKEKYLLCLLNSSLLSFYYKNKFTTKKWDLFPEIQTYLYEQLPIKEIPLSDQQPFIERADKMLSLNKELHELTDKFFNRIQDNLKVEKITKKLEKFYEWEFKDFLDELKKQKVSLSLSEQDDREPYFKEYKEKALTLKGEIDKTDNEIDEMVFDLYGLSEEERRFVEWK